MNNLHSFHIPVMGIGFTIDTPIKVAHYGIDSVIFIGDDILLEKIRKMYCEKYNLQYQEIENTSKNSKSDRVTAYLNLVNQIVNLNFEELINSVFTDGIELQKYFNLLPKNSTLEDQFNEYKKTTSDKELVLNWLRDNLKIGDINVNIMTKLDKVNYFKGEQLPTEYNDAHSTLRGYANSDLKSSVILSAGMNPRLYSYIDQFEDFFPNKKGEIRKKIVLKVSDYRSALIQGKFLAKKGIWVSEYRVESGLNCGGHAFATEGYLMGPILNEFKNNKEDLIDSVFKLLVESLKTTNKTIPQNKLNLRITAQGGVGTAEEHQFLIDEYQLDSIGWGTPFLLVPEVTSVDNKTLKQLSEAKEKDLFLSNISPLGVPFNNLRGNSKDNERIALVDKGRPGSKCPKEILALNSEFNDKTICTASRQYQRLKIKELDVRSTEITEEKYQSEYQSITEKSCLCVGLGTSVLLKNEIDHKVEGDTVSICPGPNMAYYSQVSSLQEMTNHIYSKDLVLSRNDRPHQFIKELGLYLDYLKDEIKNVTLPLNRKQEKHFKNFVSNLFNAISYYQDLFSLENNNFNNSKAEILKSLKMDFIILTNLKKEIDIMIASKLN